jgi:hypothetical protein
MHGPCALKEKEQNKLIPNLNATREKPGVVDRVACVFREPSRRRPAACQGALRAFSDGLMGGAWPPGCRFCVLCMVKSFTVSNSHPSSDRRAQTLTCRWLQWRHTQDGFQRAVCRAGFQTQVCSKEDRGKDANCKKVYMTARKCT